ncbi:S8 family serine peptidase [Streptomyces uncialis]|uniref:S8 family serine peptidase n=1 Tax=Streptomyces uncialis TaxID=1048205 RepID=UPI002E2EF019|nr:S8 family serine peptidase [Streptomyces uncialis]
MKRPVRVMIAAMAAAMLFTAIPLDTDPLLGVGPAFAAVNGPVDPPLFDKTQGGGTVRVNVVTNRRADLASASAAGETLVSYDTVPMVTLRTNHAGLQQLNSKPGVIGVSEDIPVPATLDESTVKIGSSRAAAAGKTGAGTAIAILDTGVATNHPFLTNRVKTESCFSVNDNTYGSTSLCPNGTAQQDGPGSADADTGTCATLNGACSHGTHVAGIAAGNGTGISGAPARGVAPGADIIAIQVFSKFNSDEYCGPGAGPCVLSFTSSQIKALEKVLALKQAGTDVIAANMSLGSGRWTTACAADPRKMIIDSLLTAGVATVVAAGNNGYPDAVNAPGCVSSAVTVGSSTDDDQLSTFSNRGPLLDLLAPGTSIVSSVPGNTYAGKNGTSMAAPHVAGALAVLKHAYPTEGIDGLVSRLATSGTPIVYTGASTPRLDVGRAVPPYTPGTGWTFAGTADYDGDSHFDTIARDDATGILYLFPGAGAGHSTRTRAPIGIGWQNFTFVGVADYTGDGHPDVVARNNGNGNLYVYSGTGGTGYLTGGAPIGIGWQNFTFVGVADYTGDGHPDVVARNDGNGNLYVYSGVGGTGYLTGGAPIGIGWQNFTFVGVADYTGDGHPDVVARNDGNGNLYVYSGVGGTGYLTGGAPIGIGWQNFTFVGVADYTGDGHPDVITRNDGNGNLYIYTGTGGTGYLTGAIEIGNGW